MVTNKELAKKLNEKHDQAITLGRLLMQKNKDSLNKLKLVRLSFIK